MSHNVVLSLGSNHGDRKANVLSAVEWAKAILDFCCVSSVYETEEIHGKGSPYYNCVIGGTVDVSYENLIESTKRYELDNGRDSLARSAGLVPIDIDIVIWDGMVVRPLDYSHNFFKKGYSEIAESLR